MQDVISEIKYC